MDILEDFQKTYYPKAIASSFVHTSNLSAFESAEWRIHIPKSSGDWGIYIYITAQGELYLMDKLHYDWRSNYEPKPGTPESIEAYRAACEHNDTQSERVRALIRTLEQATGKKVKIRGRYEN